MPESPWAATFSSASADAAGYYESVLVPSLFIPWAGVLLDLVHPAPGEAVIDVACGPGTVARLAAARVGPAGRVLGVDLSAAMLAVAAAKPGVEGGAPIEYAEAPADALPAAGESFDVLTCHHGLQFFPDRPAAVAEMRRVLRPGGRAGIAVWAEVEASPIFGALGRAIAEVLGDEAAAIYRGGPWGMSGDAVVELLRDAGFASVEARRESLPLVIAGGPEQLVSTLAVTALAPRVAALDGDGAARLRDAAERQLGPLTSDGGVRSHATAHLIRATR